MSIYIVEQRRKEIGVRKVLGASTAGIVSLLTRDFLKPVFLAFVIASPCAYYFMNNWLNDFAYRIDIQFDTFLIAGGCALAVAFVTVSTQSIFAASANPVNSLRNE